MGGGASNVGGIVAEGLGDLDVDEEVHLCDLHYR